MHTYLKISEHRAYTYNGSEESALELAELIGAHRANPLYSTHIGINTTRKEFSGKLSIYTRNGLINVIPGEVVMHDVVANEWFSVTIDQLEKQYRPFAFANSCCIEKACQTSTALDDGTEDTRL